MKKRKGMLLCFKGQKKRKIRGSCRKERRNGKVRYDVERKEETEKYRGTCERERRNGKVGYH